jgi:hypothetical protein
MPKMPKMPKVPKIENQKETQGYWMLDAGCQSRARKELKRESKSNCSSPKHPGGILKTTAFHGEGERVKARRRIGKAIWWLQFVFGILCLAESCQLNAESFLVYSVYCLLYSFCFQRWAFLAF